MPIIVRVPNPSTPAVIVRQIQGPPGSAGISVGTPGQALFTNAADTAIQWASISGDATASVLTPGQLTVTGLQGRSVVSTAPTTGQALVFGGVSWGPGSVGSGSISPGTAGQIFISDGTPASAWTSLISVDLTNRNFVAGGTGTDASTIIGTRVSGATLPTIYLLSHGVTANTGNWAIQGDGTHLYHNAVGGTGSHFFYAGNSQIAFIEGAHGKGTFGGGSGEFKTVVGPLTSFEASYAALWILAGATATTSGNVTLYGDGASTFINAPSAISGSINFVLAGSTVTAKLDAINGRFYVGGSSAAAPLLMDWATSLQTQIGSGTSQTSFLIGNYNTGAASVIIQGGTGGITWRDGATQTTRGSIDLAHGRLTAGGGGSDYKAIIGPDPTAETAAATVHLLPNATAPTGTNYALMSDGNITAINAIGSTLEFQIGTASAWWIQGTTLINWAIPNFEWTESLTPLLYSDVRTSNNPTHDFTIRAQYPYTLATLANRKPANLVFDIGTPTNGGQTEGYFSFTRSTSETARIATHPTTTTQVAFWIGSSAFAADQSNATLLSDGGTYTYLNTKTLGALGLTIGDASFLMYMPGQANIAFWFSSTVGSAPFYFDIGGAHGSATTPFISAGNAVTALTLGTTKAGASLTIATDLNNKNVVFDQATAATNRTAFYSPDGTNVANITVANTTQAWTVTTSSGFIDLIASAVNAELQLNATTQLFCNTANFLNWAGTHKFLRWSDSGLTVTLGDTALTAIVGSPLVQFASGLSTGTIGTNKAGASLILQTDAASTALTLSGTTALQAAIGSPATSFQINWATSAAAGGGAFSILGQAAGGAANDGGPIVFQGGSHVGTSTVDGSVKINTPLNAGYFAATLAAGTTTLTNLQSDANIFNLGSSGGGAFTINVLRRIADTSLIFVRNNNAGGGALTVAYLTGGTVSVAGGTSALICSDGVNLQKVVIGQ